MNTQVLGVVTACIAAIFLLTLGRELPADATLICLVATLFFAGYTGTLVWRHFKLMGIKASDIQDEGLFEVYLADRSWAQEKFGSVTRITAGFALAIWFLG